MEISAKKALRFYGVVVLGLAVISASIIMLVHMRQNSSEVEHIKSHRYLSARFSLHSYIQLFQFYTGRYPESLDDLSRWRSPLLFRYGDSSGQVHQANLNNRSILVRLIRRTEKEVIYRLSIFGYEEDFALQADEQLNRSEAEEYERLILIQK